MKLLMISSRGRYALRAMADLAEAGGDSLIPLKDISERQGISFKYLENIMAILTKGKLVEGSRGKGGGYRLSRSPEDYSIGEILRLTESSMNPVACIETDPEQCPSIAVCRMCSLWAGLEDNINRYLNQYTLADLTSAGTRKL